MAALIAHVLQTEAPILDGLLVQRIARSHGFQRSGNRITDRVLEIAERNHYPKPDPGGDTFLWLSRDDPSAWDQYRTPSSEQDLRRIEEIAAEEIRAAAKAYAQGDTALEVSKLFGIRRITEQARERMFLCTDCDGSSVTIES